MVQNQPLIEFSHIDFSYNGEKTVFQNASFQFKKGDHTGILAPNGSGKTTFFHLIMGLLKPQKGTLRIFGNEPVTEKDFIPVRRRIGLLFQDSDDQLFHPTVLDDVAFGPLNLGKSVDEALAISRETLRFLGLKGFEDRITFKLSGGEKRLVALASILAMSPEIILLDEPTSGLDEGATDHLTHILKTLPTPKMIISHDFDFLMETTEKLLTLKEGKIIDDDKTILHRHTHHHPYGENPHQHR